MINDKIPALGKVLNKNKHADEDLTEDIDTSQLELDGAGGKKKFQLNRVQIMIVGVIIGGIFLWGLEEEPAPEVTNNPKKKIKLKPKIETELDKKAKLAKEKEIAAAKKKAEELAKAKKEELEKAKEETLKKEKEDKEKLAKMEDELDLGEDLSDLDDLNLDEPNTAEDKSEDKKDPVDKKEEPKVADTDIKTGNEELDKKLEDVEKSKDLDLDGLKQDNKEPTVIAKTPDTNTKTDEDSELDDLDVDLTDDGNTQEDDLTSLADEDDPIDVMNDQSDNNDSKPEVAQKNNQLNDAPKITQVDSSDNPTIIEEEIIPQEELQTDISTEITKKLLQDLEVRLKEERTIQKTLNVVKPTDAPSYEVYGTGLVYNCAEKHWACIDQDAYKKCRENYSWNKNESIPIECYPVAFLESEYDCSMVQQEKIDTVSETGFCEE